MIPCHKPAGSASISLLCLLLQLPSRQFPSKDLGDKPGIESNQRHPRLVTASLLVGDLYMLSETRDMVSRVVLGQPCRQLESGAVGKVVVWLGVAWLGLAWPGLV